MVDKFGFFFMYLFENLEWDGIMVLIFFCQESLIVMGLSGGIGLGTAIPLR